MASTYNGVAANITPNTTFAITIPADLDAATAASVNNPGPFETLADIGAYVSKINIQPSFATSHLPTAATVGYGASGGGGTSHYSLLNALISGAGSQKNLRFYYRTDDGAYAITQNAIAGGGVWTADDNSKPAVLFIFGGALFPATSVGGFGLFYRDTTTTTWYDEYPAGSGNRWTADLSFDLGNNGAFQIDVPAIVSASAALVVNGPLNGSGGQAIYATGGDGGGPAVTGIGGAGNGVGLYGRGSGTGYGVRGDGTSPGAIGVYGYGNGTSGHGVFGQGNAASAAGVVGHGGSGAPGCTGTGGTDGPGLLGFGTGTGDGVFASGGSTSGSGGTFTGGASSGAGVTATGGSGNGNGGFFTGGGTDGIGCYGVGTGVGSGVRGTNGTGGIGVEAISTSTGPGLSCTGSSNRAPFHVVSLASAPSNAHEGDVYYDSGTHKMRGWDGSMWQDFW